MAGASYCLTNRLELDVGYRYTRIHGGRMFEFAPTVGPGFDDGLNVHEGRAGLRWNLGKHGNRCARRHRKWSTTYRLSTSKRQTARDKNARHGPGVFLFVSPAQIFELERFSGSPELLIVLNRGLTTYG